MVLVGIKQRSWPISYVFLVLLLHNKDRKIFLELVKQKQEDKTEQSIYTIIAAGKLWKNVLLFKSMFYKNVQFLTFYFNITHLIMFNVLPFLCNAISM